MTPDQPSWYWQFCLTSFFCLGGVLTFFEGLVKAQIIPDGSLGAESSVVVPNVNVGNLPADQIEGGSRRGTNLFHSFQEFNITQGQGVYFTNPMGVENIFSRVTGGNPSNLLGTLGVNGNANLFLLNPNGIIFGANSQLDLRGSFLGSTASSIKFVDGTEFSAINPSSSSLLTVSVPLGLQYGQEAGPILVQGQGNELSIDPDNGEVLGVNLNNSLEVEPGQTLALAGGEVVLEGGSLKAESGRVELWSLQGEGLLTLTPTNPGWMLGHDGTQKFQDISLSQTAAIDTSGVGGGQIKVQGRQVTLEDGSFILSLTQGQENGGIVDIKASESVRLSGAAPNGQSSLVLSETLGRGRAGDISVNTGRLILTEGAQLSSSTFSPGSGGKITVHAIESVEATGVEANGNFASGLFAVSSESNGDGGRIEVVTKRLILQEGAQISAATFSQGNGGDVLINASEFVEAVGFAPIGSSGVFAVSDNTGDGGTVEINTGKLMLRDGAEISAATTNQGRGGTVEIKTDSLILQEGVQVSTATAGQGKGGNILVDASESVEVTGGSSLVAFTLGTGDGGIVEIKTDNLILQDEAQISAATASQGKGGNVLINASEFVGVTGGSGLVAFTQGTGNGGLVEINTRRLITQDEGQVSATTFAQGKGGNVLVNASESVEAIGTRSGLRAQTRGTGDGGTVEINTRRLIIRDGARVSATTFDTGKGGNVLVNASESVEAIGDDSGLRVQTQGAGDGGTIEVETGIFRASGGAQILAAVFDESKGKGGNINIKAAEVEVVGTASDGAPTIIFAITRGEGNGGEIRIETKDLIVGDGGQIGAGTFSQGQGGNVFIQAADSVVLSGTVPEIPNRTFFRDKSGQLFPSGLFTSSQGSGNAGDLKVEAGSLTLLDGAEVGVQNQGVGDAGNLEVIADNLSLDNQAILSATTASGQGGNILLQLDSLLLLRRNSQISTTAGTAQTGGDGGNIKIDTNFIVAVPNENSDITANAFAGSGGQVEINAQGIFSIEPRSRQQLQTLLGTNDPTQLDPSNLPSNDITAISQTNPSLSGQVSINTPDVDPTQGIAELASEPVNPQPLQGCQANQGQGKASFVSTGRGGLPLSPEEISSNTFWEDLRPPTVEVNATSNTVSVTPSRSSPARIVEAQGWVKLADGKVILTAQAPVLSPSQPGQLAANCFSPG